MPRRLRQVAVVSVAFLAAAAVAVYGVGRAIDRAISGILGG